MERLAVDLYKSSVTELPNVMERLAAVDRHEVQYMNGAKARDNGEESTTQLQRVKCISKV